MSNQDITTVVGGLADAAAKQNTNDWSFKMTATPVNNMHPKEKRTLHVVISAAVLVAAVLGAIFVIIQAYKYDQPASTEAVAAAVIKCGALSGKYRAYDRPIKTGELNRDVDDCETLNQQLRGVK